MDSDEKANSKGKILRTKDSAPVDTTDQERKGPRGPVDPRNAACTAPKPANAIEHSAKISKKSRSNMIFLPPPNGPDAQQRPAAPPKAGEAPKVDTRMLPNLS